MDFEAIEPKFKVTVTPRLKVNAKVRNLKGNKLL
jgi:hypothetical protein